MRTPGAKEGAESRACAQQASGLELPAIMPKRHLHRKQARHPHGAHETAPERLRGSGQWPDHSADQPHSKIVAESQPCRTSADKERFHVCTPDSRHHNKPVRLRWDQDIRAIASFDTYGMQACCGKACSAPCHETKFCIRQTRLRTSASVPASPAAKIRWS